MSSPDPFRIPLKVAELMEGFKSPWFIAAGWAIDFYLGRVTRQHKDVEIAIFREDQLALHKYLRDWKFKKVKDMRLQPWHKGEVLELPVHETHAYRSGGDPSELEILLNESSGKNWVFRRNPAITRDISLIGTKSDAGVPVLSPEVVLLYKAKNPAAYDEKDFDNVIAFLGKERRIWLRQAIEVCHPGHKWLGRL